ncbi:MaoC/PaaZ C-terminal domain-containing protein [Rhodococcus sp. IEGM1428]|uniref:MaoC/PaaZ C-terminal domain-containing protein n=1 Tax=Rhodococcus sp. IEGM1428 TaxID=3392191 RepID=UPI003D0AD3EF
MWDEVDVGTALEPLEYDVTATTIVLGAMACRDYRPMHHDHQFATQRNGTRDIFMNTPTQSAWFGRYLNEWGGPSSRIGSLTFRMVDPVFPGDRMRIDGSVVGCRVTADRCGWVRLELELTTASNIGTERTVNTRCQAILALPTTPNDDPWLRRGADWRPQDIQEMQWT